MKISTISTNINNYQKSNTQQHKNNKQNYISNSYNLTTPNGLYNQISFGASSKFIQEVLTNSEQEIMAFLASHSSQIGKIQNLQSELSIYKTQSELPELLFSYDAYKHPTAVRFHIPKLINNLSEFDYLSKKAKKYDSKEALEYIKTIKEVLFSPTKEVQQDISDFIKFKNDVNNGLRSEKYQAIDRTFKQKTRRLIDASWTLEEVGEWPYERLQWDLSTIRKQLRGNKQSFDYNDIMDANKTMHSVTKNSAKIDDVIKKTQTVLTENTIKQEEFNAAKKMTDRIKQRNIDKFEKKFEGREPDISRESLVELQQAAIEKLWNLIEATKKELYSSQTSTKLYT